MISKILCFKDIIVLLFNAGPLNINSAVASSSVKAIIECFLPAQSGGEAVRRILFNDNGNPAGRLPYTWPKSISDVSFSFCLIKNIS
jgi:beta-glucosidase